MKFGTNEAYVILYPMWISQRCIVHMDSNHVSDNKVLFFFKMTWNFIDSNMVTQNVGWIKLRHHNFY